jgi:hypothetical protein
LQQFVKLPVTVYQNNTRWLALQQLLKESVAASYAPTWKHIEWSAAAEGHFMSICRAADCREDVRKIQVNRTCRVGFWKRKVDCKIVDSRKGGKSRGVL